MKIDKQLAEEIYEKKLLEHGVITEHSDSSWKYWEEYDAVIDAILEFHDQKNNEITDADIDANYMQSNCSTLIIEAACTGAKDYKHGRLKKLT